MPQLVAAAVEEARSLGASRELLERMTIALSEALNNIVEHATRGQSGHRMEVEVRVTRGVLSVRIGDDGAAMPGGVPPAGRLDDHALTPRQDLPEGGFGWGMIRALCDELRYSRAGRHNRLELGFRPRRQAGPSRRCAVRELDHPTGAAGRRRPGPADHPRR